MDQSNKTKSDNQKQTGCPNKCDVSKRKTNDEAVKNECDESASSSDCEDVLPENILETEKSLHASAVKNNLDETSVRKILKKVVTNDHVLALVKLREEDEKKMGTDEEPKKITRSKIKEFLEVKKKPPPWKPWALQLSPIKHIPVKTRPEVTALIDEELPEDEDDEEYEPTNDDVLSDDDHTIESCSDIESQPRTPATPKSQNSCSPQVIKDGPFIVPQRVAGVKRKLEIDEEEATIARRTRSKLSLSSTSIEHIESTFVPPDEVPMPVVDDLWSEFLNECLNPADTSKHEDDDETDPEYNAAADPDAAVEEDDDTLGRNILRISKKELNDLVTELFTIMPEALENEDLAENLANTVLTENSQSELTQWEGKQEPLSDDEATVKMSDRLTFEKKDTNIRLSIGKSEPDDVKTVEDKNKEREKLDGKEESVKQQKRPQGLCHVKIIVEEQESPKDEIPTENDDNAAVPPLLRSLNLQINKNPKEVQYLQVEMAPDFKVLPEQILILQQQLRQHIQLATSNFLQLYVHPIHWRYGPQYMEYVETFTNMCDLNPDSVANVDNLKPAFDLMTTWKQIMAENTQENTEMIKFIQEDCERSMRRISWNNLYTGEFHDTFKKVVANSTVFLYPHLLPPVPYRAEAVGKKFVYVPSEDELIAIGLDEFWQYIESNPKIFKIRANKNIKRPGLVMTVQLMTKYMFPWMAPAVMKNHVIHIRNTGDTYNPIVKFFKFRKIIPVVHKLLPFNPRLTLYEQPEIEMPKVWIRYLAKTSQRFKSHLLRSSKLSGQPQNGVTVEFGKEIEIQPKNPLPIDFIGNSRKPKRPDKSIDRIDVHIEPGKLSENVATDKNLYNAVETSTGSFLLPRNLITNNTSHTTNCNNSPISTIKIQATLFDNNEDEADLRPQDTLELEEENESMVHNISESKLTIDNHCVCCKMLQRICNDNQRYITDYFTSNKRGKKSCYCKKLVHPRVTNRLKLLINNYDCQLNVVHKEIERKLSKGCYNTESEFSPSDYFHDDDLAFATLYQIRLIRGAKFIESKERRRLNTLFANFDTNKDSPLRLAHNLKNMKKFTLLNAYTEFMGFLNPEQAEKENMFLIYLSSHMNNVMKIMNAEITNKEKQCVVLKKLQGILKNTNLKQCEMCSALLSLLDGFPKTAKYVFSLFYHKVDNNVKKETNIRITHTEPEKMIEISPLQLTKEVPITNQPMVIIPELVSVDNLKKENSITVTRTEPEKIIEVSPMHLTKDAPITNQRIVIIPQHMSVDNGKTENNITKTPAEQKLIEVVPLQLNKDVSIHNKPMVIIPDLVHDESLIEDDGINDCKQTEDFDEMNLSSQIPSIKTIANGPQPMIVLEPLVCTEETFDPDSVVIIKTECDEIIEPKIEQTSDEETNKIQTDSDDEVLSEPEKPMVIVEDIKTEPSEWTREEDKLILELLMKYLKLEERKHKSIIEILEEKRVVETVADIFKQKPFDDVQERIVYLLELLVNTGQFFKSSMAIHMSLNKS